MKNSDVIKTILLATINELVADPAKYAANPGKDFTRNRKMGFIDTVTMLLTMEGDCIKEELYRYFGRNTNAPSKAAFYKQRSKLNCRALASLLMMFNSKLKQNLYNGKYRLIACDGLLLIFLGIRMIRIHTLNQTGSPPEALTRFTSMPFFRYLTEGSQTL